MEKHIQALEKVRKSGVCNMFDRNGAVQYLMKIREFETVYYLWDEEKGEVNVDKYVDLLHALGERRKVAD